MIKTTKAPLASAPQVKYIFDLARARPLWINRLSETDFAVVAAACDDDGPRTPITVHGRDASRVIGELLKIAPTRILKREFTELQRLLKTLRVGHYALPRKVDNVLDFFEVIERPGQDGKPATRWVNRLLGAPGDWNRDRLSVPLQAAAARAISGNWVAAAQLYADHFQACARCDAPLSNPRSRAAKIGHDCAKVWGWKW